MTISNTESKILNSIRFCCIVFLVLLHTGVDNKIGDSSIKENLIKVQELVQIPFLNILFLLSGYLFFLQKEQKRSITSWMKNVYTDKLRKRVRTLLVPFVLWCVIALIYNTLVLKQPLPQTPIDWIMQFWDRGDGIPVGKAMWYMRNLIVFSILSPLYLLTVKYCKHCTLVIVFTISLWGIPVDYPFFNVFLLLGAYLALTNISLEKTASLLDWRICIILYIILKSWHFVNPSFALNNVIITTVAIGALWKILSIFSIPTSIATTSSAIYFMHSYFVGVRNVLVKIIDKESLIQCIAAWWMTAVIVLTISICLFFLLKKIFPIILRIATGDRI